jgi:hypothetical protein
MSLLDDFDAFLEEHRRCGEIEVSCSCGARIVRKLEDDDEIER